MDGSLQRSILSELYGAVKGRRYGLIGELVSKAVPEQVTDPAHFAGIAEALLTGKPVVGAVQPTSYQDRLLLSRIEIPSRYRLHQHERCSQIGPEFDALQNRIAISPASLCNKILHWASEPIKDVAIVACCRNEGPWILEWVAYHRAMGVRDIFLSYNDIDDQSNYLINSLSKHDIIFSFENISDKNKSPQNKFYNYCSNFIENIQKYRWIIFIDLDEFLIPTKSKELDGYNIVDMIGDVEAVAPQAYGICLPWMWSSGNFKYEWEEGFVTDRFLYAIPDSVVKCVVKPEFVWSMHHPHVVELIDQDRMVNSSGDSVSIDIENGKAPRGEAPLGQINHYYGKSFQEFALKRSRGRALSLTTPQRNYETFRWGQGGNLTKGLPSAVRAATLREWTRLMEFSAISTAVRETVQFSREKLADLEASEDLRAEFEKIRNQ